jgi:hypothetical protein
MKRFTETLKWQDKWFRRLTPRRKCLWQFLCDTCDPAGVIDFDAELASVHVGETVEDSDIDSFGERIRKLPSGKLLIVQFVKFQYGELSESCPAHKPVFRAIKNNGLDTHSVTHTDRVSTTLQEEDKDIDKDKDKEEEVALPAGFPKTPAKAHQMAEQSGCNAPIEYIEEIWDQAKGRGGRDGANVEIRMWGSHAKKRWGREEMKWRADRKAAPSPPLYAVASPDDEPELAPWQIVEARKKAEEEAGNANQRA